MNWNSISFLIEREPLIVITITGGVFLIFLLWKEFKNRDGKWKWLRVACSCIMIISLILIGIKPVWEVKNQSTNAILLTVGYDNDVLKELKRNRPSIAVFNVTNAKNDRLKDQISIPDLYFLQSNFPFIDTLFVLGEGVNEYDLAALDQFKVEFFACDQPEGVVGVRYRNTLTVYDSLSIAIKYNAKSASSKGVVLSIAGEVIDSVILRESGMQWVKLKGKPKSEGKFLIDLQIKDSLNNELGHEKLPVEIQSGKILKLLMMTSYPTFEIRYLKNWLGAQGHEIAIRNKISNDRYTSEFINSERSMLNRITHENLEKFDVVIADAKVIAELSLAEKKILYEAVSKNGLGLLINYDETWLKSNRYGVLQEVVDDFKLTPAKETTFELILLSGLENKNVTLDSWPFVIPHQFNRIPVIASRENRAFISTTTQGRGRVGLNLMTNSYKLLLKDDKEIYAMIWTKVLTQVSKKHSNVHDWKINTTPFVFKSQPMELTVKTNQPDPIGVFGMPDDSSMNSAEFYFSQDINLPLTYHGIVWPDHSGWHKTYLKGQEDPGKHFYVFNDTSWSALRRSEKIRATKNYKDRNIQPSDQSNLLITFYEKEINPLWFFVLFLLSAGCLWLEPKL